MQLKTAISCRIIDFTEKRGSVMIGQVMSNQKDIIYVHRLMVEELKSSTQQLTDILESITDGFLAVDKKWNITYINKIAEKLLMKNRENVIGKNIWDELKLNENSCFYQAVFKAAVGQEQVHCEDYLKDYRKWVEAHFYPSKSGLAVIIRDISLRKQQEEHINRREREYKTLVENSPDMIARFDRNMHHLYVNPAVESIFQIPAKRLLGKSWKRLGLKKEEYSLWQECLETVFVKGCDVQHEIKISTKFGIRYLQAHATPEFDKNGQVESVLVVTRDITDQRRAEREIARLDSLNLIGQMAASIGHEVRNPMTTVRGFLQIFRKKSSYLPDQECFDIMIEELDRANSILTEFLSLAKNKSVELYKRNLNTIVETMMPLIRADSLQMGRNVELKLQPIPNVLLDEKEIRQMVLNLVRNGLEATINNGMVTIETFQDNDQVVLAIKDQGEGIPSELREHIGTPFFTTKDGGTGLGLPVCFSIAKRHNAQISFETGSAGTIFYVRFAVPG